MNIKIRSEFQILFVVLFATITLAAISAFVGGTIQPQGVYAQAVPTATPKSITITDETLKAFGLPLNPIVIANAPRFDLEVVKQTNVVTVNSGSLITFTISITNHGPNPAEGVFFQDFVPSQMETVEFDFSSGAIDNGASNPEDKIWLLTNSIPVSGMVAITVTGQLTSARDITVTNTAMITTYNPSSEIDAANNSSEVKVGIVGWNPNAAGPIYLPIVSRFPTPTPVPIVLAYYNYFNDEDDDWAWFEFDNNGCETDYNNGRYQVKLDDGADDCLPPAKNENHPEKPYRTYGEFEVAVYHSEGESDAAMGIFINGDGGDDYYVFKIRPNNSCSSGGKWELRRRKDGSSTTILSKNCDTAIERGYGSDNTNVLRIAHKSNRQLILYINGTQVGSITETASNERKGQGTGVFVQEPSKNITIKFDNFKVYRYP